MEMKELRLSKGLTQSEAAALTGLKLRTYQNYEAGVSTRDKFKIEQINKILTEYEKYTADKGILSLGEIKNAVISVCKNHSVHFVILFGSYAKGTAGEKSDVDLFISCEERGLNFIGLADDFSKAFHKEVDVIRIDDVMNNMTFLEEILITGIKIYGESKE